MDDSLEIQSDDGPEQWLDFLREVETRCTAIAAGETPRTAAPPATDAWSTENGDPIDPVAWFVTFTGID